MLTRVPAVIDELAQGNPEALTAIAMYKVQLSVVPAPGTPAVSYGLGAAVICREQFVPDEDIGAAGRQAFPLYPASISVISYPARGRTPTMTVPGSGSTLSPRPRCVSPS